ncbi:carbohydrate esterase family 3 protein [Trichoderma barbatum]
MIPYQQFRRCTTGRLPFVYNWKAPTMSYRLLSIRGYGSNRLKSNSDMLRRSILLMPLGGSITYGVESSDTNGYRKYLQDMLIADGHYVTMVGSRSAGSMCNNNHEGWRGFRIDQIKSKARSSIPKFTPNLVLINAGSNDCIQDFKTEHIGIRMGDMLELVWNTSPGSTIILSTLILNLDDNIEERILWANDQFQAIAIQKETEGKRIVFVDMHSRGGPEANDISDGTHPNDRGYYRMAEIWYRGVLEAISKGFLQ